MPAQVRYLIARLICFRIPTFPVHLLDRDFLVQSFHAVQFLFIHYPSRIAHKYVHNYTIMATSIDAAPKMDKSVSKTKGLPWSKLGIHRVPEEDEDKIADLICENCQVDRSLLMKPFWVDLPFTIFLSIISICSLFSSKATTIASLPYIFCLHISSSIPLNDVCRDSPNQTKPPPATSPVWVSTDTSSVFPTMESINRRHTISRPMNLTRQFWPGTRRSCHLLADQSGKKRMMRRQWTSQRRTRWHQKKTLA